MPPHSPHSPCSAHTPSTSSIFHLLVEIWNICTKMAPATPPTTSAPSGMHDVGAGAHRDEAGERAVVHEARIVVADDQRRDDAAAHGHQRVDGDEAGDRLEPLRAHHVEAEPADAQQPGAHGQPRDRRRRRAPMPPLVVAAEARPEHQHGAERDPAAERVHDDRAGEILELARRARR